MSFYIRPRMTEGKVGTVFAIGIEKKYYMIVYNQYVKSQMLSMLGAYRFPQGFVLGML